MHNISVSEVVKNATGAVAVAEPSAILAAKKIFHACAIITKKEKRGNVTLAIAEAEFIL
jgi:cobalamin biosynthesis protein CbiG